MLQVYTIDNWCFSKMFKDSGSYCKKVSAVLLAACCMCDCFLLLSFISFYVDYTNDPVLSHAVTPHNYASQLNTTSVDLIFAQTKSKGQRRLTFERVGLFTFHLSASILGFVAHTFKSSFLPLKNAHTFLNGVFLCVQFLHALVQCAEKKVRVDNVSCLFHANLLRPKKALNRRKGLHI